MPVFAFAPAPCLMMDDDSGSQFSILTTPKYEH